MKRKRSDKSKNLNGKKKEKKCDRISRIRYFLPYNLENEWRRHSKVRRYSE
jgi:hypothetical protein